jgi:integrase
MLPVPKYNPRPPKATITEEQFRMIQRGARNSWIIWPVTLSWYTGMAWVDCCHLKWNEIDFHRRIITKRRSKSSTICQIPFLENGELHRNLLAKQAAREPRQPMTGETCVDGDEYVCAVSARRYHGRGRDAFTRALVAVGLNGRGISIHSLRVSFCSRMANSGVSSAVAMRMTGHTNGTMFARYVRCDVGALHQALEQSISGQPAPQPTGQLPPDPAIISITPHLSRPEMPDSMDNLL